MSIDVESKTCNSGYFIERRGENLILICKGCGNIKKFSDITDSNGNGFKEKLNHKWDRIYLMPRNGTYELYLIILCDYIISIKGLGGFIRSRLFEIVKKGGKYSCISGDEGFRRTVDNSDCFKKIIDKMKSTNEDYMITIYLSSTEINKQIKERENTYIDLYNAEDVKDDFINKINRCYGFKIDREKITVNYK